MGFGIKNEGTVSAFVEPTILSAGALEANVNKNFNMISLFGKSVGRLSFYGQGAGKYPTGNALAHDILDILNGDTALTVPEKDLPICHSKNKRSYFIRTKSALSFDFFDTVETVGDTRYILTAETDLLTIHKAANALLSEDSESFFAGIEN